MNIHMNVGNVNGLFHTEAINRKFNKNTEDGEGKTPVFLRRDIAMISPKGKAMSAVERLMKQKDFIMECKDSLLERMTDEESGYSSPAIMKQIDEYDKQLDSIDKEIAKELAKPVDASDKSEENNLYKKDRSVTKQELDNKKMAELTEMSTGLSKSEQMDSVKNRLEGEKHVLEAELKINDSESKRQRIAEIDERTAELTKETFAGIGEIINKPEKDRIELSKEGLDYFQDQIENGTKADMTVSGESIELKRLWEENPYDFIIENSDDGFHKPTMESELWGAYNSHFNAAWEKGLEPGKDVYEHIVDIHKNSLVKAYQDVYHDIVSGYENGTREIWTQNFDEGADYIEFESEGKTYRYHKLTMEEELARLDNAYEKAAKDVEDRANLMVDIQKIIEKVMPEYQEKLRQIEAQRAGRQVSAIDKNAEIMVERLKDKILGMEEKTERINLFEMLMAARKNWLNAGKVK